MRNRHKRRTAYRHSILFVSSVLIFFVSILYSCSRVGFIQTKSREKLKELFYLQGYLNESLAKHFCFFGPHSRSGNPGIFPSPVCVGKHQGLEGIVIERPIVIYNITPDGNVNHAYHGDIYGFHFFLANCLEYLGENIFIGLPHLYSKDLKKELGSKDNNWQTWAILLAAIYSVGKNNILFADSRLHCFPYAVVIDGGAWETYWTAPFSIYPVNLTSKKTSEILLQAPESMKAKAVFFFQRASLALLSNNITVKEEKADKLRVTVYARMDTNRRIWRNCNETLERLEKISCIEIQYVEKMPASFIEQVRLFYETDIFIAPHGAANVNSMFMQRGRFFIEIENRCKRTAGSFQWAFWHAPKVGVQMKIISCTPLHYQKQTETHSELIDFNANTDELMNVIHEAISSLKSNCK
ncbi:uncharacterized protein Gasu_20320 [Galdieria sulphuraria]|uniref:Glycosyltransferase 61 catalytic domain-containing protein n=1 Tax=Galdieria sulphuraria TaxID=130081 RepID=M2Y416_GALSU|nr:uncharacterized protein Gasu_20320 [Galdieria sulphuraria]EME30569.1 hypothetical protein Gasu_20320 [Galdieria sulphuraria]|eukprot:XP_005707089.1 hypothetical protein Gasu_20320 [Galdieria sulphuraria]